MLTGHGNPYKTVQARAGVDSVVLRYPIFYSDNIFVNCALILAIST